MNSVVRFVALVLSVACLLYVRVCALVFFSQRSLIYFPQPRWWVGTGLAVEAACACPPS
jgi:hypothetical protein